jgi:hypothetical protein
MKLKELLDDTNWSQIEEALIRLYEVTPHNLEGYMSVVQKLSTMTPKESNMRICINWIPPDGDFIENGYWDLHGKNGTLHKDTEDAQLFPNAGEEFLNSEVTWALEFNKWEKWLGMEIDTATANDIRLMKADIVAHALWEMTFCGYEEEEIKEQADELKRRSDEVKNMSEEELKKNCCTLEEFKEKIQKLIDEEEKGEENGETKI